MRILVVCVPLREGIYLLVTPDLAAAIPWVTAIEQPSDLSTLVLPAVGGKFFFWGGGGRLLIMGKLLRKISIASHKHEDIRCVDKTPYNGTKCVGDC